VSRWPVRQRSLTDAKREPQLWWQFVLFCCVGAANTAVDAAVFAVLVAMLGWRDGFEPAVASMLGFAAGAANSYFWNSRVTFQVARRAHLPALGRFAVATGTGMLVSGATFIAARELWPHESSALVGAKVIALGAGTVTNFTLQRLWVFRARTVHSDRGTVLPARGGHPLVIVMLAALVIRVPLILMPGYWWDMELFSNWAATGAEQGLLSALHRPDMDYVGYNYVLTALGFVYLQLVQPDVLASDSIFMHVLKLPALAGDMACVALLYFIGARCAPLVQKGPRRVGAASAALYAFNPAVLYDSAYWGQVDSLVAASMLGAIAGMLARRPGLGSSALAVGFLVKPHPILLIPLLVWLAWRWTGVAGLLRGVVAGVGTAAAGLAYFWLEGSGERVRWIYSLLFETGPQISVSAWNGWWALYRAREQTFPADVLFAIGASDVTIADFSTLLLMLATALVVASMGLRPVLTSVLVAAAFLVFAFFMLPMKMHERYLFPLFAVLAPVAVIHWRWFAMYALLSITFVLNLYSVFPFPLVARPEGTHRFIAAPTDAVISAVNVGLFVVFAAMLAVPAARDWRQWLPPGVRAWRGPAPALAAQTPAEERDAA
jgi:putative flippase GtrA